MSPLVVTCCVSTGFPFVRLSADIGYFHESSSGSKTKSEVSHMCNRFTLDFVL